MALKIFNISETVNNLLSRLHPGPQYDSQGSVAFIDMESKGVKMGYLPMEIIRGFLGGRGTNMFLLANLLNPESSPLAPDVPLIYGAGLLSGIVSSSARGNITGWSPESRILLDANAGDDFSPMLRLGGIDHLVIYNRSPEPSFIVIENGDITFKPAGEWWGMNNLEFRSKIAEKYSGKWGADLSMLNITSAGENGALTAGVMAGIKAIHARGGGGAKMGAMHLKGILIITRKKNRFPLADEEGSKNLNREVTKNILNTGVSRVLSKYGTPFLYKVSRLIWAVGTRNNQDTVFSDKLDVDNFDEFRTGMTGCYRCPVRCRPLMDIGKVQDSRPVAEMMSVAEELGFDSKSYLTGDGPEYVTVGKFGSNIGVDDPASVIYLNNICNDLGLDTSGTGGAVAWAIECFKRGLITEEDTGFPINWGDAASVARCLFLISRNEGFGRVLASGSHAVEDGHYPVEALDYRMTIKGLMQSDPHDARIMKALALGVAVSTRGFDHLRNRPALEINARINDDPEFKQVLYRGKVAGKPESYEGKEYTVKMCDEVYATGDSLGICRFTTRLFNSPTLPEYEVWAKQIKNTLGINFTQKELEQAGINIRNLERFINYSLGVRKEDDTLPRRWFDEPVKGGPYIGEVINREDFSKMLDRYYSLCRLNDSGIPVTEVLRELNRLVFGFNIDIHIHSSITDILPENRIAFSKPVNSLAKLIDELDSMHPGLGEKLQSNQVNVSINGMVLLSGADEQPLSNGDEIEFFTVMGGG